MAGNTDMPHNVDPNRPWDVVIAELIAERKRLDDLLDDALEKFALYEEDFNNRLKTMPEDQRMLMFAERIQMEEMLGIADLVDRLDHLRDRLNEVKALAGV